MSDRKRQKVWNVVWGTYLLCYAFRILEYFVLRTDQTLVGEAIVHKLMGIGIFVVCVCLDTISLLSDVKSINVLLEGEGQSKNISL